MRGLCAAILLCLPAYAQQAAQQAQAPIRQALPPDVSAVLSGGDLAQSLAKLPQAQRAAALSALSAQERNLGSDPDVLAQLSAAYLSLGSGPQALSAAQKVLAMDPQNPDALGVKARVLAAQGDKNGARQLLAQIPPGHPAAALAQAAIQLGRDPSAPAPAGGGFTPAAAPGPAALNRTVDKLITGDNVVKSAELAGTLTDAKGANTAQLAGQGINFKVADPAKQADAVTVVKNGDGTITVSLRPDALQGPDARETAHVGNGIRQAQTYKDHPTIGWLIIKARGWFTGGKIHEQLAPGDVITDPQTAADTELALQRRLLSQRTNAYNNDTEHLGTDRDVKAFMDLNQFAKILDPKALFERFMGMSGRATP